MEGETNLKMLKRKRAATKGQLTRFETYVKGFSAGTGDYTQLEVRIDQCQKLWTEYNETQLDIEVLSDDTAVNDKDRADFEELYFRAIGAANALLANNPQNRATPLSPQVASSSSVAAGFGIQPSMQPSLVPSVKFPAINLPSFSGNYEEFMSFFDSYKALIHDNPSLSDIERFHYLRSALQGEAAQVISCLETTSANYNAAWKLIQDRYHNKKLIIHNHVKALHEIPSLTKESYTGLRQLLDNLNKHIRALESLGEPVKQWDTLLIFLISSKFDNATRREWEIQAESLAAPTMSNLTEFINKRCNLLQTINYKKQENNHEINKHPLFSKNKHNSRDFQKKEASQSYLAITSCPICKQSHKISVCDKFLQMNSKGRYIEIKKHKLCTICLNEHAYNSCTVESNCQICNKRHHLLLHFDTNNKGANNNIQGDSTISKSVSAHSTYKDNQVLLSTAIVYLLDATGKPHECKVLLDSGSQSNFLSKEFCDRLKIPKQNINIPISGLGQVCTSVSYKATATILSKINKFKSEISFLIVDQITENLPLNYIDFSNVIIPNNLILADPSCNVPSKIDALLGASIFWSLLCVGQIKLTNTQIIAQKTKLGWILSGQVLPYCNKSNMVLCHFSSTFDIQKQLESFWQLDHCESRPLYSQEQRACEDNFVSTHKRECDGRFVVNLPMKCERSMLGNSLQMATKRFHSLERKLQSKPELKSEYVKFMDEYKLLGHMSEATAYNKNNLNYVPHHAVIKRSSSTTPVRVVFDCSAKTESGKSLNDILMVGPTIQRDLFSILLKFRKHQYVITADCAKMYRQVKVCEEQRSLQAILWRTNPSDPLKTYTLNTVTYGTSCAPFLAIRCLFQMAEENKISNPLVSKVITQDTYVDDVISGADSVQGIFDIRKELSAILSQGQFTLRKWRSNYSVINDDGQDSELVFSENKESKTLGLVWNSEQDIFIYNLQEIFEVPPKYVTKRTILSYVSKIYDVLGLIGPVIIRAKIIMQKLWQLSLTWDESLPQELYSSWIQYVEEIQHLKNIKIPRLVLCKGLVRVELHAFSDASVTAYGTSIYLRSLDSSGVYYTYLLCAKSRVAPLKNVSIPRLELCGALLSARLANTAIKSLDMQIDYRFFWCDSSIVLTWILDEPYKWTTFVGNRVAEIQDLSNKHDWRHIRSDDNPADIISRGISPVDLLDASLWWHGPKWLAFDSEQWPESMPIKVSNVPEEKRTIPKVLTIIKPDMSLFERFSNFLRLQRVVAFILRFKNNALKRSNNKGPLTVEELDASLTCLLKLCQSQVFAEEINSLSQNKHVNVKSKLFNLNPFLDRDQVVRVGGRLRFSNVDYDQKHPAILPKGHPLTKLIIIYEHRKMLHFGAQALLANIRTRFWPISGRDEVKKLLKQCVVCFKVKPFKISTLLGQLPEPRVTPFRAFLNCACDYAGPFMIKVGLSRSKQKVKGYLCVFICLATKALHLELVTSLTTECFLNAFKRFIARRGKSTNIYSDNGTTFVGANRELNSFLIDMRTQGVFADFFTTEHIKWHFIPPRSPHFGGIWESAVKAVKYHLRRVMGNMCLTYEEFTTIIVQIEACLNSRPLSPLSVDSNDLNPLTPGHFLIGAPLLSLPEPDLKNVKTGRLNRYQLLTQTMQHFWARWSRDYLTELQCRSNTKDKLCQNVKPGMMVLLVDENLPPLQWAVGRVLEVHPGADDVVRVATVKTVNGTFKRAVRKLCVLPIDTD